MDEKKTLIQRLFVACLLIFIAATTVSAQNVKQIKFCDKKYEYGIGKDSITLYFNVLDLEDKPIRKLGERELSNYLVIKEDGNIISSSRRKTFPIITGRRIPSEYTFSVLVDLSIPEAGKAKIYDAICKLVESAPNGCVYLSFFGDEVTPSVALTKENVRKFKDSFSKSSKEKYFYGALYAKLAEFSKSKAEFEDGVITSSDYKRNTDISQRASKNPDQNILFIFTEGYKSPAIENNIGFIEVEDYQNGLSHTVPRVFAFYYTEEGQDADIENILQGVSEPKIDERLIENRVGRYMPAKDMSQVLSDFIEAVNDQMYDYAFVYKATEDKTYNGKVRYSAEWKGDKIGDGVFDIGGEEGRKWPERAENAMDTMTNFLIAILVTLLTIAFFFVVMKVLVPFIQSKAFEVKYYKKYVPEANVSRRICHYCKQEIQEGQSIVVKCKHIMHVHCWQQNGYKCAEYGQNCKTGIQSHVEWKELLTWKSLKDCHQTMAGIFAGFISWILYELAGRGGFDGFSKTIVSTFYTAKEGLPDLSKECIGKTSAFLTIGLLLGFFLSMIFGYNDEYRNKDWKIALQIVGLSLLTSLIGVIAFAIGADILCSLLSVIGTTYIPWYCSFPAYILFSVGVALALTIKSSIPMKSALIGGGVSSIIGFIVLYFSSFAGQMSILLDFIIYGGGLGASLVTVRMLAEKYFLVFKVAAKELRIPIHKWMNATGGGNKVTLGMTGDCEIQMNWEKSNKVAKEHAQLYIDHERQLPMLKSLATGVIYNTRAELPVGKPTVLSNGDTFKIGDTTFQYVETE